MATFGDLLYGNESAASYDVLDNAADLSEVVLSNVTSRPPIDHHQYMFRFILNVPVSMPIIILGIIANLVEFTVLCHHKSKRSTTILLQGLAVIDIMVLVSSLLRCLVAVHSRTGTLSSYRDAYPYIFICTYPLSYLIRLAGNWLTILLTIDRYIAVCRPLDAQRICTKKRAYMNMAVVIVMAALFSAPRLFEIELSGVAYRTTALTRDKTYTIVYRIVLFSVFTYVVPVILMTILNFRLLWTLHKANEFRSLMRVTSQHSDSSVPATQPSVTIVVLLVVLVCIVCNSTAFVSHLLWSLEVCFAHLIHLNIKRRYLSNISNAMVCLNSAVNFFIYCLCSRNFRQQLVHVFGFRGSCCRCCMQQWLPQSLSSSSAATATQELDEHM